MRAACGLRVLVPASLLPATVGAQPPVLLAQWGSPGSGPGQFNEPLRVAVDAAADVYVVDWERESLGGNSRIQKFTGDGTFITQWGWPGSANGQLDAPPGWRRTWPGNVFVVARLPRRGGRTGPRWPQCVALRPREARARGRGGWREHRWWNRVRRHRPDR